jgi:hypothetical protein
MGYSKEENGKKHLFMFMESMNDDDLPDGAWEAVLEAAVEQYNELESTNFDPHTMFLEYVRTRYER